MRMHERHHASNKGEIEWEGHLRLILGLSRDGKRRSLVLLFVAWRRRRRGSVVYHRRTSSRRRRRRGRASSEQILLELHYLDERPGVRLDFFLAETRCAQHDLPFLWQALFEKCTDEASARLSGRGGAGSTSTGSSASAYLKGSSLRVEADVHFSFEISWP
jgi:hypothetical protein